MKKHLSILALCLLATGCAETGQVYDKSSISSVPAGQSQLIIYMPVGLFATNNGPWIEINGEEKCRLPRGAFMTVDVPPGLTSVSVEVTASPFESKLDIEAKAHTRHYIRAEASQGKIFAAAIGGVMGEGLVNAASDDRGDYSVREISPKTAQQELHGLKQSLTCK